MNNELFKAYYGFWFDGLTFTIKNNKPILERTIDNFQILIDNWYKVSFCKFRNTILFNEKPITDIDLITIKSKIGNVYHTILNTKDIKEAVISVSNLHQVDTLKLMFEDLVWDGQSYIPQLVKILNCSDTPTNRVILRKWLISAVARVFDPGCYTEGTLILYGEQAAGKSSFFKYLNLSEEYYCASPVDISNPMKVSQTLSGKHIIEFAELSCIQKSELENTKQFLTTETDTYTPKFANFPISVPRRMIFGGSTNNPEILFDTTGNRRFWCLEVGKVDVERLKLIKHMLWAEMVEAYKKGESTVLTPQERDLLCESNKSFEETDPLHDYLADNLQYQVIKSMPSHEILEIAKRQDLRANKHQVSRIMKQLGWQRQKVNGLWHYLNPNYQQQINKEISWTESN